MKKSKKSVLLLKKIVKETDNKIKSSQDEKKRLEAVVTLTYRNFMDEGITIEMFSKENIS